MYNAKNPPALIEVFAFSSGLGAYGSHRTYELLEYEIGKPEKLTEFAETTKHLQDNIAELAEILSYLIYTFL